MPNSTTNDLGIQSITFGNSLIPIGALTTLIGSDIAETLALGERGPAGLVWSVASAFGAPSVIKACISGASPGWVRSLLGLRSLASDRAIGLDLKLAYKSSWGVKVRRTFTEDPLGVFCDAKALQQRVHSEPLSRDHPSCNDVYAFDRSVLRAVEGLQKTHPGNPLTIYSVARHPSIYSVALHPSVRLRNISQPLALALSLLKCSELYYHWTHGSPHLALISAIPFAFFFVSGWVIAVREIFLARRLADTGNLDAIIGDLPTWKKPGGEKRVVLGLLAEPRTSIWWRIMWSVGGLLHVISLIFTYFILSKMAPPFTLWWATFQVVWLACRVLTYYFTEGLEPMAERIMVRHRWQDLDVSMKTRVLNLTLAAAQYQSHIHPRGVDMYTEDSFSPQHIMHLFREPRKLQMSCELPHHFDPSKSSSIEIEIHAMIGDTVLSSAMWMVGSDKSPMDMYDSCLFFLSFPLPRPRPSSPSSPSSNSPPASFKFAIPSVRVANDLGGLRRSGTEDSIPIFVPRAASGENPAHIQTWLFWIPCGPNRWLKVESKDPTILGRCTAQVLDDVQLSALLGAGNLNISLTHAKEIKEIVNLTCAGVEALFKLLPGIN